MTHYENDTAIREELAHILNAQDLGHVVLIDDSNCFGSNPAYPTIEEVKELIMAKRANARITVKDYIIRVVPRYKFSVFV